MDKCVSAPLLSRIKAWQLIGLGISGWLALYSIALISWGASSTLIGNAQGGCFAATMALASFETKRHRKCVASPTDALQWANGIPTEHLNQTITLVLQKREYQVETCQRTETELGFGVRAVNSGRTLVFETGRWLEPVIDLPHAQNTEDNRKKVCADVAIIVGAGQPDEAAQIFAKTRPIAFFAGPELKALLAAEKPVVKKPEPENRKQA